MEKINLIMLPGWGMQSPVWAPIQNSIEEYCRLFFIEWDNVKNPADFKQKVVQLIDRENLECFSLLGWSMGSLVALEIAEAFNARLEKLVLIGGTSCFTSNKADGYTSGWAKRIVENMKAKLLNYTDKVLQDFYTSMFSEEERANGYSHRFFEMVNSEFSKSDLDTLDVGLDYLIKADFREKLKLIQQPVLIIHGFQDRICPSEAAEYIKNNVQVAESKSLADTGHLPFFTKPDVCATYIKAFLKPEA